MSFISYKKKPNLVDRRLIEKINNKFMELELKEKIQEENIKQSEICASNQIEWYDVYVDQCKDFIKINYGFVIISVLIVLLLYIRYIEVKKRKARKKKYIK